MKLNYCSANGHNFITGRLYVPLAVLTVATLIHLSCPGKTSSIIPIGQFKGGAFSCITITIVPGVILGEWLFHFALACKVCKYSNFHLFQKS